MNAEGDGDLRSAQWDVTNLITQVTQANRGDVIDLEAGGNMSEVDNSVNNNNNNFSADNSVFHQDSSDLTGSTGGNVHMEAVEDRQGTKRQNGKKIPSRGSALAPYSMRPQSALAINILSAI